jgi:3-oxoacyl-[acyl-carrier-protein] synthase II
MYGAFPPHTRRRVVVTGIGMVTPLGACSRSTWHQLLAGHCAARKLTDVPYFAPGFLSLGEKGLSSAVMAERKTRMQHILDSLPCGVAAPVTMSSAAGPGSLPSTIFAPTAREPRSHRFADHAVREALADAGLLTREGDRTDFYPAARAGVNIGVGMPSLQDTTETAHHLFMDPEKPHYNKVHPFFVPKVLGNMPSAAAALRFDLQGPLSSATTACATGAHCIGEAMRWIQHGLADMAVCGATEACITPISIAGFCRMKALSTKFNDQPEKASRPFDSARCGFVMGEGAGVLVLEALDMAEARGARRLYAEARGFGMSSDAYHVSSPHPDGRGAKACIRAALADGGVDAGSVVYCNAHATGTPLGDEIELHALEEALRPDGASAPPLLVSSTKGSMGHLLGAAGSVEAALAILSLEASTAPATAGLEAPVLHDSRRVDLVAVAPRSFPSNPRDAILSTSFGFGGANSALIFTRAPQLTNKNC